MAESRNSGGNGGNASRGSAGSSASGGSARIRTREHSSGIKVYDRAGTALKSSREVFIRTRQNAARTLDTSQENETAYAQDRVADISRDMVGEGAYQAKRQVKKAKEKIDEKIEKKLEKRLEGRESEAGERSASSGGNSGTSGRSTSGRGSEGTNGSRTAPNGNAGRSGNARNVGTESRATAQGRKQAVKTAEKNSSTIKQSARSSGRQTIKTAERNVKTARQSIKTSAKTAKTTVKTTEKAAQAAKKSAEVSAKAAEKAAVASEKGAVAAVKSAIAAIKAMAVAVKNGVTAAGRAIYAAIGAIGGSLTVIIFGLLMVLVAILCTGDTSHRDNSTIDTATILQEINTDWQDQINTIVSENSADDVQQSGTRASWSELMAIYTAKEATETIDDWEQERDIKEIFWEMHSISYETKLVVQGETAAELPVTIEVKKADVEFTYWGGSNPGVHKTETVTYQNEDATDVDKLLEQYKDNEKTVTLVITIHKKSLEEMEEQYQFDDDQKELAEVMSTSEFDSFWLERIYGISGSDGDIVSVALSQLGNTGGYPYWAYAGFDSRVEWCACFVSWCAGQCGYIDEGLMINTGSPPAQVEWFKSQGRWYDKSITPEPGMIIFFDWYAADFADHVGIVEKVENGIIYTVEGNCSDSVMTNSWAVGDSQILGFGRIK